MMPIAASVSMSLMLPESMNSFMPHLPVVPPPRQHKGHKGHKGRFFLCVLGVLGVDSAARLFVLYWIGELADAVDRDRHRVAGSERTDAFRRAGRNDVARLERHHEGDELDEMFDRKNQLRGGRGLPPLAVDPAFDGPRSRPEAGGDA